jgi:hypothetical protein
VPQHDLTGSDEARRDSEERDGEEAGHRSPASMRSQLEDRVVQELA